MGRRDRDERPPVEPWNVDPAAPGEVQRVEVGPGGGSRRTGLLVGVVAVLVLGVGLVIDRGDDDAPESAADGGEEDAGESRSSTRRRRATTTTVPTTTTTRPAGPVFGEPVEAGLLTVSQRGIRGIATWIDLDTGERLELVVGMSDPDDIVAVRGGVVAGWGATVWYQPLPAGKPVQLSDRFASILASGSPDTVWLVESAGSPDDLDGGETSLVTLVDLEGRRISGPFEMAMPVYDRYLATANGVIYSQGGRTFLVGPAGTRAIAVGEPVYAHGTSVAVSSCDEQAHCGVDLIDLTTGTSTLVDGLSDLWTLRESVLPAPDGEHLAVLNWGDGRPSLEVRDRAGTMLWTAEGRLGGQLRWLPGDLGLVIWGGSDIRRIYRGPDGVGVIERVPALNGVIGDRILVIPR